MKDAGVEENGGRVRQLNKLFNYTYWKVIDDETYCPNLYRMSNLDREGNVGPIEV